jgi:glycosyltransferase involved in cell wall biosynthesis
MPVLNGARYIDAAIGSILAQTFQDFELIVVDDGSTDATPEHIERFARTAPVRHVRHPRTLGIARSVNDGLAHSTGEYIAFLDHDDAWLPHFLQTQVSYLDTHPDVGMVHSDFQTIDGDGRVLEASVADSRRRVRPSGHVFPQLFMDSFVVGNSVLVRKACFDRLGGFDETLRWADYNMWMRIARQYRVDYVGEVLTQYRQHAGQQTRSTPPISAEGESVGIQSIRRMLETDPEVRNELGGRAIRRRLAGLYFDMAYASFQSGDMPGARSHSGKALRLWPWRADFVKLYAAALLPRRVATALRSG